jgi:hypothetical protein
MSDYFAEFVKSGRAEPFLSSSSKARPALT